MNSLKTSTAVCLALFAAAALAERPVYKNVDAAGKVTYSDRKNTAGDTRLKNWTPAPSPYTYDAAVRRTESDRQFYQRLLAERRTPVPVVIYDPRGWQAARSQQSYGTGRTLWRSRWDPNLPDSPAPSFEPHFYYNNR